jgi:hypothetical protein
LICRDKLSILHVVINQNTVLSAASAFRITHSIHLHAILNFEVECPSKFCTIKIVIVASHIVIFIATSARTSELTKNQTVIAVGTPCNKSVAPNFLGLKPEIKVAHVFHHISSVCVKAWLFSVYRYSQLCLIRILTRKIFHYFSNASLCSQAKRT